MGFLSSGTKQTVRNNVVSVKATGSPEVVCVNNMDKSNRSELV